MNINNAQLQIRLLTNYLSIYYSKENIRLIMIVTITKLCSIKWIIGLHFMIINFKKLSALFLNKKSKALKTKTATPGLAGSVRHGKK